MPVHSVVAPVLFDADVAVEPIKKGSLSTVSYHVGSLPVGPIVSSEPKPVVRSGYSRKIIVVEKPSTNDD